MMKVGGVGGRERGGVKGRYRGVGGRVNWDSRGVSFRLNIADSLWFIMFGQQSYKECVHRCYLFNGDEVPR